MSALFGERVMLGQKNGPEVELVVYGDEWYATYETPSGYPAVYDENLGLFCYARLAGGQFESTGVPVSHPPPPDSQPHAQESPAVRQAKVAAKEAQRAARGQRSTGTEAGHQERKDSP